MVALKCFSLCSFLLLAGCAEYQCRAPGLPSGAHQSCFYHLTIKKIDSSRNMVVGADKASGQESIFRVRDIDVLKNTGQLEQGKDYVFGTTSNSPYLELFNEENQEAIKKKIEY